MKLIEIVMPLILISLAFSFKLFIDRTVTTPNAIEAILDLPADIAFFSLSILVSFTITQEDHRDQGFMLFAAFVVLSAVVIFLWRRSLSEFAAGKRLVPAVAGVVNYIITFSMAIYAIGLVTGGINGN